MRHLRWLVIVSFLLVGLLQVVPAQGQGREMVRALVGFSEARGIHRSVDASEREVVMKVGGAIRHAYRRMPVVAVEIPRHAFQRLQSLPGVAFVEEDGRVWALEETLPWGVDRIDADLVHIQQTGVGVRVAVLDSGIDLDHPDLLVAGQVSFIDGAPSGDDDYGHGTHVAGIIGARANGLGVIGVAPEAELYSVKVLDYLGSGYWSDVARALEWSVDNGMHVVNMSLGGTSWSRTVEEACESARDAGLVLVAAAGNRGTSSGSGDNVEYPARFDSVIAAAAIDADDDRASFSGTGPSVELCAPGVSVTSTTMGGGYGVKSGTSMSSPHVAGVAALIVGSGIDDENGNGRINDEVRLRLQDTAEDLGTVGRDYHYGFGLVDAYEAVPVENQPPVADAGPDQSVSDGDGSDTETVTLDGSGSYDVDGSIVDWIWQASGTAIGAGETLDYEFPIGMHVISLTVADDEDATDTDTMVIDVGPNQPPQADAGPDLQAWDADSDGVETVILDGTASWDPDGAVTAWTWSDDGTLQGTGSVQACEIGVGSHTITLVVTDNGGANGTDSVTIEVGPNQPPIADAGPDQSAMDCNMDGGEELLFDGSSSSDFDGTIVSWEWFEGAALLGSGQTLSHWFPIGMHTLTLVVTDNGGATAFDEAILTIEECPPSVMKVDSIDMELVEMYGGWRTYATAQARVVDLLGNPVPDAAVAAHWEGATTGTESGLTDSSGEAYFSSDWLRYPGDGTTFIFVIDSLSRDGWTYDELSSTTTGSVAVETPPTPTPAPTPTPVPTSTPTPSPTPTLTPTPIPSPTLTPGPPTPTPSPTPTVMPSPTPTATPSPTGTPPPTPSPTPEPTPTSTPGPSPTPDQTLRVGGIDMELVEVYSGWRTQGRAIVLVVDGDENPVSDAFVAGHWEVATSDADSGSTGNDGTVTFESNSLRFPSSGTAFVFIIDSVIKEGWSYDQDNSVTTGTVVVP